MTTTVTVNFSDQAYATLAKLAASTDKPMSEVLREAIQLMAWYEGERAKGNRILIETPNHKYWEMVRR